MESINQTVATTPQVSSPTPTASVPTSVSQPVMSDPSAYQAAQVQQVAEPQVPAYQPTAAPQASAPEGNPWQQAFQALSASLNTPQQSPAQASYSAYQTPTPQASTQATWASQAPQMPQAQPQYQAAQTYSPQVSTPTYSQEQLQALAQAQTAQSAAPAGDSYLSQISDNSLEVLEHFGAEAPALLNQYACAVEDALIEQVGRNNDMNLMLGAAGEERAAMNLMLTNPDILADYVNDFFGPSGPYPTETADETQVRQQQEAAAQFEAEIQSQEQRGVPQNFQRPQMEMPTPGQRSGEGARGFWGDFSALMDNNPENAWQYLASAPAQAFTTKVLVQDS